MQGIHGAGYDVCRTSHRGQWGRSNGTSLYASGFWVQVVTRTGLEEGSRNELLGLPEAPTTSRMALL